jgi:hypothetical protein
MRTLGLLAICGEMTGEKKSKEEREAGYKRRGKDIKRERDGGL